MTPFPVDAVILAAGSSARLGSPKALARVAGVTTLERVLSTLEKAGIRSGVVVTGEHFDAIRTRIDVAPLHIVRNPTPEAGRMGSIVIGLAATDAHSDALLWPVDRPLARVTTVAALLDARTAHEEDDAVFVPEEGGRRGHPILIAAGLRSKLLAAPPDANLREVLARAAAKRIAVPVDDDRIHENLDAPEDLERLNRIEFRD